MIDLTQEQLNKEYKRGWNKCMDIVVKPLNEKYGRAMQEYYKLQEMQQPKPQTTPPTHF